MVFGRVAHIRFASSWHSMCDFLSARWAEVVDCWSPFGVQFGIDALGVAYRDCIVSSNWRDTPTIPLCKPIRKTCPCFDDRSIHRRGNFSMGNEHHSGIHTNRRWLMRFSKGSRTARSRCTTTCIPFDWCELRNRQRRRPSWEWPYLAGRWGAIESHWMPMSARRGRPERTTDASFHIDRNIFPSCHQNLRPLHHHHYDDHFEYWQHPTVIEWRAYQSCPRP